MAGKRVILKALVRIYETAKAQNVAPKFRVDDSLYDILQQEISEATGVAADLFVMPDGELNFGGVGFIRQTMELKAPGGVPEYNEIPF